MVNSELLMLLKTEQKEGRGGGGGAGGWGAIFREKESTVSSCDAKAPSEYVCVCIGPGVPDRQAAIITSGCQHDTVSRSEMPAGTVAYSFTCRLACMHVWVYVNPVCRSLTAHTSLSGFIWTVHNSPSCSLCQIRGYLWRMQTGLSWP